MAQAPSPSEQPPIPVFGEGGSVLLAVQVLDYQGAPDSPAGVILHLLVPGDTLGRPHSTFVAGGQCCAVVALHTPGVWRYRFEKTTEPPAVYEGAFVVEGRAVPSPP